MSQKTYEAWFNDKVKTHGRPKLKLLDKKSRDHCFATKKAYLSCVDKFREQALKEKNFGLVLKNCNQNIETMFGACPTSWCDHYIRGDMVRNFTKEKA